MPRHRTAIIRMNEVRMGVVGLGAMGSAHARLLLNGQVPRCRLAAVCHRDPERTALFAPALAFSSAEEMMRSGKVDALLIATPHPSHTPIAVSALKHGLHILVEKPVAVHKAEAEHLLAAADQHPTSVFSAMFNVRTRPYWKVLRDMVRQGELGTIRRIQWNATAYFRTEAYYQHNAWRGTWKGEGGGVLLNQCPHQLDLLQWIFGMPARVRGFCRFGYYHDIEVEDDVTAYMEYESGTSVLLTTSTGEAPGSNRIEISADRGRVTVENHVVRFQRNEVSMSEFSRTSPVPFESYPPVTDIIIPAAVEGDNYVELIQNFTDAILDGTPLLAPGAEAIHSLELANAILLSSCENRTVELPMNSQSYESLLQRLIAESESRKL